VISNITQIVLHQCYVRNDGWKQNYCILNNVAAKTFTKPWRKGDRNYAELCISVSLEICYTHFCCPTIEGIEQLFSSLSHCHHSQYGICYLVNKTKRVQCFLGKNIKNETLEIHTLAKINW